MNAAKGARLNVSPREQIFGIRVAPLVLETAPPLFLFCAALVALWQYDPLHRSIVQDPGIFAYLSQIVAQGFAPHQTAFNEQASLTFLVGGAAMWLGDFFGVPHILSFRLASMITLAGVVVLTYYVGWAFTRSRAAGFLAGAILIGYQGYNARAATALEPKSFMLLLGLAALYLAYRRKWAWAGAFAGAAGLAWQIGWDYLVVVLLLAFAQGGGKVSRRLRAAGMAFAAALLVFGAYTLFFVAHDAQLEMLRQTVLAPLVMHNAARQPLDVQLARLPRTFVKGFAAHTLFGAASAAGLVVWLGAHLRPWEWKRLLRRTQYFVLHNRRTAGVLLVTAGFVFYSFLDFQNYPDWIPLLPYISIFAAWLMWSAYVRLVQLTHLSVPVQRVVLAALALAVIGLGLLPAFAYAARPPAQARRTWQEQQRVADELSQKLEPNAPLWLLGQAELLFFMGRHNVNKYIYVFGWVDAAADAFEPGGFRQVITNTQAAEPVLIALSRVKPRKFADKANLRAVESVAKGYVPLARCRTLYGGRFFVRADRADDLFPKGGDGCLKR